MSRAKTPGKFFSGTFVNICTKFEILGQKPPLRLKHLISKLEIIAFDMRITFGLQLVIQNGVLVRGYHACMLVGLKRVFITMMFGWCMHVGHMRAWLMKIAINTLFCGSQRLLLIWRRRRPWPRGLTRRCPEFPSFSSCWRRFRGTR